MEQVSRERHVDTGNVMRAIETNLSTHYESQWKEKLQAEFAVRGEQHGRNKLRTYRMFKECCHISVEGSSHIAQLKPIIIITMDTPNILGYRIVLL